MKNRIEKIIDSKVGKLYIFRLPYLYSKKYLVNFYLKLTTSPIRIILSFSIEDMEKRLKNLDLIR